MGSVGQISLFDGTQRFRIDKPIRLIELFAGIGSQAKALTNLGVDFEHYRICEFDKYAVTSYNAIHGTNFQPSDITKLKGEDLGIVDTDKYCYLLTYSFPCQDLSNAGKGKGMEKGSGTRSGLLWEVERLLTETKNLPQVLVMENVPQVASQKNIQDFAKWIAFLDELGYKSKWAMLNAKDYGIPQNRERCFMVSILGDYYYEFPSKMPLKKRLKDMLEDSVNERYYLSETAIKGILNTTFNSARLDASIESKDGVMPTLCARDYKDGKLVVEDARLMQVAQLTDKKYNEMTGRVYGIEGLSPTVKAASGGCFEPKVAEPIAYDEQNEYLRKDGCVGALTTAVSSPKHNNRVVEPYRIRKLTPRECYRLMGFADEDVDRVVAVGMSNVQLYKQAGNSIVTNVMMEIFRQML